jgi:hypothetical protein
MPSSIEKFKRAFAKHLVSDAENLRVRREKVQEALDALTAAIDGLEELTDRDRGVAVKLRTFRAQEADLRARLGREESTAKKDPKAGFAAMEELKERAREQAAAAEAELLLMRSLLGDAPDPRALGELAKTKDGAARLDELMARHGDSLPREVVVAALEVRFGVEVETVDDPGLGDDERKLEGKKSLQRVYELMSKVPDSHSRDNESLKKVRRVGGMTGDSSYKRGLKMIVLQCGRPEGGDDNVLVDPKELVGVETICLPREGAPTPKKFDWTTLHEVGHAVDAQKGFMDKKLGKTEFGGWKKYDDYRPVAKAAAKHFKFDLPVIEAFLRGEQPNPSIDDKPKEWVDKFIAVQLWAMRVLHQDIWNSASDTEACELDDGRVYHRAYEHLWVSYEHSTRKRGISGYQFRAPSEWFAELYAAYHSGVLRDNHPAAYWLRGL